LHWAKLLEFFFSEFGFESILFLRATLLYFSFTFLLLQNRQPELEVAKKKSPTKDYIPFVGWFPD